MIIGILTFHFCDNYGAVLQAYALKRFLEIMGHQVYFIDYKPSLLLHRYDFIPNYIKKKTLIEKLRYLKRAILSCNYWISKRRKFYLFRRTFFSEVPINYNIDLLIVGSDQVWNPKITGGYDEYYYANNISNKKFGFYAVSSPPEYLNEKYLENIKKNRYPIGVREPNMKEKLLDFGIKSTHVVDPTLLLPLNEWNMLIKNGHLHYKYILSYYSTSKDLKMVASSISKEMGLRNLILSKSSQGAGPQDFLTLLKNAELILTGSFHGTVFSIIFHRPFLYFPYNNSRDDRVLSLLNKLDLNNHVYNKNINIDEIFKTDWIDTNSKLNRIVKYSKDFIKDEILNNDNVV